MGARLAYVAALLLVPTGAMAQAAVVDGAGAEEAFDAAIVQACAEAGIGAPDCPAEGLAETLGLMSASDVEVFTPYHVERFALLTAMRHASSALFFIGEDEGCIAEEERSAAIEIWSAWVHLPDTAPAPVVEKFEEYAAVINELAELEVIC